MSKPARPGDSFGGFNALAAALACMGVFFAALLQSRTLREVRQSSERDEAARRFEQTQSSFFEMLRLARELAGRVTVSQSRPATEQILNTNGSDPPAREGDDALDSLASSIRANAIGNDGRDLLTVAVRQYSRKYAAQPSRLGPYFRLLFQIFQLIDTARITVDEKRQLAKIARGQISEGAVLLLALNALTWRGWAFTEYVERYGLLEHMHHNYAKSFKPALKLAFLETAFLGSGARDLHVKTKDRPDPTLFDESAEAGELRAEAQRRLGITESENGSAPAGAKP